MPNKGGRASVDAAVPIRLQTGGNTRRRDRTQPLNPDQAARTNEHCRGGGLGHADRLHVPAGTVVWSSAVRSRQGFGLSAVLGGHFNSARMLPGTPKSE